MKKKFLLAVVVLTMVALVGSSALALAPMGPPTAGLKTGQFRVGFDYAYSEMDLKGSLSDEIAGYFDLGYELGTLKDVQSNMILANLGFGMTDDWELFVRLGAANADFDEEDLEFSGDYGFAWGLGTKVTFLKQENLNWGALFQIHWINSEDTFTVAVPDYGDVDFDIEVDAYEMQVAVGPTWKVNESLSIYGGPFLHFLSGDIDASAAGVSVSIADIKQDSVFGGYVGVQLDLKPSPTEVTKGYYLFGEFQFTGDAWGFGTGIGWKF